ncbi:sensor histidine kinase [Tahibacter amnicola]|uniref:histidine kinase n=1 Tax=Tahibacter amnicola TaxID=2976241 RepID=A0ABY6B7K5_9GAMM|nr:two-component regulator propeller domain-containing protein [Tahibacter amnicola]UXI65880.1 ATP-binding protein [Tahibacter amnicola]
MPSAASSADSSGRLDYRPVVSIWRFLRICLLISGAQACFSAGARAAELPDPPPGHYVFRSYGPEQGLTNTSVVRLLQDRVGFLWVGTEDGLYRYDGYRFDEFGLAAGLPSTHIYAIHEDPDGQLWVGTLAGLCRRQGRHFVAVAPDVGLPREAINGIADGPSGLWIATPQGPFARTADGRFTTVADWPAGEATALWRRRQAQRVWLAHWNGQGSVLSWNGGHWTRFELHAHQRIDAIVEDGGGRVWARTPTRLWVLEPGATGFVEAATPLPLVSNRSYLAVDRRGELWVSNDRGLMHRGETGWNIIGPRQGLPGGPWPFLEDREGSIWVGTVGLHRLLGRGAVHAYTTSEGLPYNVVWCIHRDRRQRLWVGTSHGLAVLEGDAFRTIAGTESNTIRSIVESPDGRLYMSGVPGNDVLIYDPASERIQRVEIGAADPKRTFRLLLDGEGLLWASTDRAGLFHADTRADTLRFEPVTLPGGSAQESVSDVRADAAGRIWAAGRNGLALRENGHWRRFTAQDGLRQDSVAYVFPRRNGELLVPYVEPYGIARLRYEGGKLRIVGHLDNATTQSADKAYLVGEDRDEQIWIGGGKGVDVVGSGGTVHFGYTEGLVGEDTASMSFLAEASGNVWIGTTQGLVRVDTQALHTLADPVPPTVALIDITLGKQSLLPTDTTVQTPYGDNTFAVRFAGLSFLGEGKIEYRERLAGRESEFNTSTTREARYSALAPGRYRYEVAARVVPYGAWGPATTFEFEVLPAWWQSWWTRGLVIVWILGLAVLVFRWRTAALLRRNRVLEAQVAERTVALREANLDLSRANLQLHVEIDERVAAQTALTQQNSALEALNQRLVGTQNQLLQSEKMASVGQLAAGVAHEINTPIAYVRSNLGSLEHYWQSVVSLLDAYARLEPRVDPTLPELVQAQSLKASIELDYLRDDTVQLLGEAKDGVDKVKKIVSDLRDFSHLDGAEWQSVDVHEGLASTLNLMASPLRDKEIEVVTQYADLAPIDCQPFQLNQVFLNVLTNAVQSISGKGRIILSTGQDDTSVWIRITDTGCGIAPEHLPHVCEPFFTTKPVGSGTGLGLSVAYGIVQAHGGHLEIASEPGQGTQVTIRLPRRSVRPLDAGVGAVSKPAATTITAARPAQPTGNGSNGLH